MTTSNLASILIAGTLAAFVRAQTAKVEEASTATPPAPASTSCGGPVAGGVIGTFFATLILIGLIYFVYRRSSQNKKGKSKSVCNLTSVESNDEAHHRYAYDNPYFEDDGEIGSGVGEVDNGKTGNVLQRGEMAVDVGGRNGLHPDNKVSSAANATVAPAKTQKKGKTAKANLFSVLTTAKLGRHRALDDSCIHLEPERLVVPLRGIDFTGLGFNVCGNMRDGIYIKDVLHRGPAMESGKIKAGDRILSLTVSFANMVYEDALTILSYASPYDVQIEVQKMSEMSTGHSHSHHGHQKKGSNSSNISSNGVGSTGSCGRERLYHPLYRSQSIGDLSKIGKDDSAAKRSSSIGAAAMVKPPRKEQFVKLGQSFNEEGSVDIDFSKSAAANVSATDVLLDVSSDKPKTSRFHVQKVVESEIQADAKKESQTSVEIVNNEAVEPRNGLGKSSSVAFDQFVTVELNDDDSQVKRNLFGSINHDDDDVSLVDGGGTTMQISPDIHAVPLWVTDQPHLDSDIADSVAIQTHFSSDNDSSDDEKISHHNEINGKIQSKAKKIQFKEVSVSGTDRRASSLGDLTSVDEINKKNFPLERSVSMDLNHAELIHGKLAMQQIEQLGPKLNENGAFGATENLHLGSDGEANGHCNFLKSWDQVESLAHVGDEEEHEDSRMVSLVNVDLPPPIPISPAPHVSVGNYKKDEGDLWEVDLSERELSDEICSTLSDDSDEPQMISKPPPTEPPPTIKRMIAIDAGIDQLYDSSSSSSSDDESDNRQLINVLDVNDSEMERLRVQPTSIIHHDVNTGSSTVTIGCPQPSVDKQKAKNEFDPEMAKIFNNVTVSNTSRDLFTLDIDNWVQNGSQSENDNGFRNGNGEISPVVVKEQYESVMNFDLESPESEMDKVGVIRFESTPPGAGGNNMKKSSSQSSLTELGGVSRTLIIANPQLSNTTGNEIRLTIDQPPSLQPPPPPPQ